MHASYILPIDAQHIYSTSTICFTINISFIYSMHSLYVSPINIPFNCFMHLLYIHSIHLSCILSQHIILIYIPYIYSTIYFINIYRHYSSNTMHDQHIFVSDILKLLAINLPLNSSTYLSCIYISTACFSNICPSYIC